MTSNLTEGTAFSYILNLLKFQKTRVWFSSRAHFFRIFPHPSVSQKCINQRLMHQSAYPGTPLPKRSLEASRTNRRILYQSAYPVPIGLPCTNQRSMYQSAFGVPISISWYTPVKTPLRGVTYQSAYPGTPLPRRSVEASRTNRHIVVQKRMLFTCVTLCTCVIWSGARGL